MSELVDEQLDIAALRNGDAAAFARLVRQHQTLVMRLGQSLGLRGADLDDAAAEVFAAVFRALPHFEGRSALGTWIYRIAFRVIPKVRQKFRSRASEEPDDQVPETGRSSPLAQTEQRDTEQRIWSVVKTLDERSAMIVEMFYRRSMGVVEIADIMQCPTGTVKSLLFRARQRLKELLASEDVS